MVFYVITKDDVFQGIMTTSPYEIFKVSDGYSISTFNSRFPDLNTHEWNNQTGAFERKVTTMTKLSFLNRFTLEERIAARSSTDPVVIDILKMLDLAEEVDLNYPPTIQSIQYMASIGILTPTRATEVLS